MHFTKLVLIFVAILSLTLVSIGEAHVNEDQLRCSVFSQIRPLHTPKLLKADVTGQGFVVELYDITGDGLADIAVYSPGIGGFTEDGQPAHHDALFYELDNNGDQMPDEMFIDQYGTGLCVDLVLYYDNAIMRQMPASGLVRWDTSRDDLMYDGRALEEVSPHDELPMIEDNSVCRTCESSIYDRYNGR